MKRTVLAFLLWVGCGHDKMTDASPGPDDLTVAPADQTMAEMPDLAAPDLATPDLAMPDLTIPDLAMPDLAMPDLAMPDLAMPDLAMPDQSMPDLATPDLARPDLMMPDLATPDLTTPDLTMNPDLTQPDLVPYTCKEINNQVTQWINANKSCKVNNDCFNVITACGLLGQCGVPANTGVSGSYLDTLVKAWQMMSCGPVSTSGNPCQCGMMPNPSCAGGRCSIAF